MLLIIIALILAALVGFNWAVLVLLGLGLASIAIRVWIES